MTRNDFISAIGKVNSKAAVLMIGHLDDPKDCLIKMAALKARNDASNVLHGVMVWGGTPEGHEYWSRIHDKLEKNERNRRTTSHE
jgi:ribosomal protein L35AE/L33A